MRLLDHAKNVYSQYGEDGIFAAMLEIIPDPDKWCVEFGAWDGEFLSNTCNMIEHSGYSAVMIEANRKSFAGLLQRHGANPKVVALNQCVGFSSADGLDTILAPTPVPKDFDLLSIDIDGNDYHVWKALSAYTPKIVCVEFNPTVPTEVDFVQPADPTLCHGASLLALTRLGRDKGYELVAVTRTNVIFVQARYFPLFGLTNNEPRVLREDTSMVTHIFCGHDGTIFFTGADLMPWHGLRLSGRLRKLPGIFRRYPENFSRPTRKLFNVYRKVLRRLGRG
jgi:hypothetical protein